MADEDMSAEAVFIKGFYLRIKRVIDKSPRIDLDIIREMLGMARDAIQEIGEAMKRPTIRGHDDPQLHTPAVSSRNSTIISHTRRLRNQVRVVCTLADLSHEGPAANDDEADALNRVKQTLLQTLRRVTAAAAHVLRSSHSG